MLLVAVRISAAVATTEIAVDPCTWSSRLPKALSPVADDTVEVEIATGVVVLNIASVSSALNAPEVPELFEVEYTNAGLENVVGLLIFITVTRPR